MFTDINALEPRIRKLLAGPGLTAIQREAAEAYLRSMELIHAGKDPGSAFNFDDE